MRVASENGYDSMHRWIQRTRMSSEPLHECIRQSLDLAAEHLVVLMGPLPQGFGAWPLPMGLDAIDFNNVRRRWCARCLVQAPVLRGQWEIKLACVCHQHRTWLTECCFQCSRFQRWGGTDFTRCECGASLSALHEEAAQDEAIDMSLCLSCETASLDRWPAFERLTLPMRHRFVRYLGLLVEGAMPPKPGKVPNLHCLSVAKQYVVGAAKLLDDWPKRFECQLALLHQNAGPSPSLKETFGALYRVLYSELSDPAFQFARDAFEGYLRQHWWGLVGRRNRMLQARTVEEHPRLTLTAAADAANIGSAVARHLVQAEMLDAVTVTLGSGRRLTTVHQDAVAPLTALVGGAMTLKAAAEHAALPERRIRQLIKAGVLQPLVSRVHQRSAAWLIARKDLDRMCIHVRNCVSGPSITLRAALKHWRLKEDEAVALLNAVLEGGLQAQSTHEDGVPIGLAVLARRDLRSWLIALRTANGSPMSIDEAAVLLGVKQQVAYDLVRAGLLVPSFIDAHGRKVSPSDLVDFEREFIALVRLAKAAKRSPKALLDALATRPVTGPCIDGARQYFYRRAEVEAELAVPNSAAGLVRRAKRCRAVSTNAARGAGDGH